MNKVLKKVAWTMLALLSITTGCCGTTRVPTHATVLYRNGNKVVIDDWTIRYTFGESDSVQAFGYTYVRAQYKWSSDLHLLRAATVGTGSVEEIVIPGDEIERIRYIWDSYHKDAQEVVILTKAGEEYSFNEYTFYPTGAFLSSKKYVGGIEIHLIGWTSEPGVARSEFTIDLRGPLEGGSQEKIPLIDEILFE